MASNPTSALGHASAWRPPPALRTLRLQLRFLLPLLVALVAAAYVAVAPTVSVPMLRSAKKRSMIPAASAT